MIRRKWKRRESAAAEASAQTKEERTEQEQTEEERTVEGRTVEERTEQERTVEGRMEEGNGEGTEIETNAVTLPKRGAIVLILLFLLTLLLLGWSIHSLSGSEPEPPAGQRDVLLVYAPSPSANEGVRNLLRDAAAQFRSEAADLSQGGRVYLLPGDGKAETVDSTDAVAGLLNRPLPNGTVRSMEEALEAAEKWADGRPDAAVVLLTDRVPEDTDRVPEGETAPPAESGADVEASAETDTETSVESDAQTVPDGEGETDAGPYDETDTPDWRAANAAYQAAARLSFRTPLTVAAATMGQSGRPLAFTRRFCEDIQTAGFLEIPDPSELAELCRTIARELLAESETRKLSFRCTRGREDRAVCYYTDQYFAQSSYNYNQSLATMSLSLALSALASGGQSRYASRSANVRALLQSIGVRDKDVGTNRWFTRRPETDSIGVAAGSKPITVNGETFTLIAAAVRGGDCGLEWAGSFTIGGSGPHNGFAQARDQALDYLKAYIAEKKITGPVKFWVTGFSRGGAAANLVGGALDDGVDFGEGVTYGPEDVYAYCFEPPAGALAEEVRGNHLYNNIFNIINQSDPVPSLAPAAMGFARYGIDRFLPSAQSSSGYLAERAAMLRVYNAMDSAGSGAVDDFQMKKLDPVSLLSRNWSNLVQDDMRNHSSQGVYLSNYVTLLAKEYIRNRETYAEKYQDEIREVCSILYGCTDAQRDKLADGLVRRMQDHWGEAAIALLNPMVNREKAFTLISGWLVDSVRDAGIKGYHGETLRSAGAALSDLLLNLLSRRPSYAATLAANLPAIGEGCSWELCWAWMASMDDNYKRGAETAFHNGDYRIVRVNGEADVQVWNADGAAAAEITDDVPRDIRGSSILSAVNENGEKIVILPFDSAYTVTVTRREDEQTAGRVCVGIDEYTAAAGDITRGVDYMDLSLAPGAALTANLPAREDAGIEGGTSSEQAEPTAYTLTSPAGAAVPETADLSGAAAGTVYNARLSISVESGGVVLGGGPARYGDFVQAEAVPAAGYLFDGWYLTEAEAGPDGASNPDRAGTDSAALPEGGFRPEGEPVSTAQVYRFAVTEDTALTAHFVHASEYGDSGSGEAGGAGGIYPFRDVLPGSYCYDAVRWAAGNGIATGTRPYQFSPNQPCSAAHAVTFLWRAAGSPAPMNPKTRFKDVDRGSYCCDAVCWAGERYEGLGTSQTTFSPNRPLTRAQFITLFFALFGRDAADLPTPFRDVPEDSYFRNAAAWAWREGITVGTASDTFSPWELCSRGQITVFLYRYFAEQP